MKITRKNLFVKKEFQIKIILIIILSVFIFANVTGSLAYFFLSEYLADTPGMDVINSEKFYMVIIPVIASIEFIGLVVVFILSLFVSHSMAGPIYRIEKLAEEIGQGDLSIRIRVRKNDEFQDLAEALDNMIDQLRLRIKSIREISHDLSVQAKVLTMMEDRTKDDNFKVLTSDLSESIDDLNGLMETLKIDG